jgi:hypothetical protein
LSEGSDEIDIDIADLTEKNSQDAIEFTGDVTLKIVSDHQKSSGKNSYPLLDSEQSQPEINIKKKKFQKRKSLEVNAEEILGSPAVLRNGTSFRGKVQSQDGRMKRSRNRDIDKEKVSSENKRKKRNNGRYGIEPIRKI